VVARGLSSFFLSLSLFLAISLSFQRAGGKRTGVAKLRKELERFYQVYIYRV
jgi:hypothetical protein